MGNHSRTTHSLHFSSFLLFLPRHSEHATVIQDDRVKGKPTKWWLVGEERCILQRESNPPAPPSTMGHSRLKAPAWPSGLPHPARPEHRPPATPRLRVMPEKGEETGLTGSPLLFPLLTSLFPSGLAPHPPPTPSCTSSCASHTFFMLRPSDFGSCTLSFLKHL